MKNRFFTLSLFLLFIHSLFAQQPTTQSAFQLDIRKAKQIIKLDGDLSETDWQEAAVAKDFQVHYPQNGQAPKFQTEARATYDKNFLYVGFVCYDTGKYVIQTLKRDVDYFESDGVSVVLDPNARQINGFFFGTNTEGVQTEGLLGGMDMSLEWDNKWYVETKKYVDRWTAEMAIPFKTLRYDPSNTVWNINFIRNAAKEGNWHTW
ncbi:MAG TPA: carbohydrate binding family 9 domain-containing protein, partial [Allocoleopsis sp.]